MVKGGKKLPHEKRLTRLGCLRLERRKTKGNEMKVYIIKKAVESHKTRTKQNLVKLVGDWFKMDRRILFYVGSGCLGLAATKGCGGAYQWVKKKRQPVCW